MPTTTIIPQTALAQGATGQRVSAAIPADSPGYSLTIQQVGWPHTGRPALKVWLDVSYDAQQTWVNLTEDTLPDEASAAVVKNGVTVIPADAFRDVASIDPEVGGVPRRLRLRYEAVKAVTVSGTIVGL
jgi:hypothetical protein